MLLLHMKLTAKLDSNLITSPLCCLDILQFLYALYKFSKVKISSNFIVTSKKINTPYNAQRVNLLVACVSVSVFFHRTKIISFSD